MSAFIVFLSILFIAGIGFAILRGFHFVEQKNTLLAIGASYGLGAGLIGLQLYAYSRFNIPWQNEYLFLPWVLLFVFVLIRNRKTIRVRFPKIPHLTAIEKILFVGIVLTFCYVVFEALLRPVVAWDSFADWLWYSKMFFLDGHISLQTLHYGDSGYPMTISLLGTFIYLMLGHVDDTAVLLLWSAYYIFLAIAFFAVLKERYGIRYALFFTLFMVTTQNFVRHAGRLEAGMADMPLGYFAFIAVVFLFSYFKKPTIKALLIVTAFLSITALIKYEGIPITFCLGLCAFIYIVKKRFFKHLFILFLCPVILVIWEIDRKLLGIEITYFSYTHALDFSVNKSIAAFVGTFKELINVKSWNVLWITYFYSLIAYGIRKQKEVAVLHFVILCQLGLYLILYNTTFGNTPSSSIERLLMHIAPLAFLCVAIVVKLLFRNKKFIFL